MTPRLRELARQLRAARSHEAKVLAARDTHPKRFGRWAAWWHEAGWRCRNREAKIVDEVLRLCPPPAKRRKRSR